MLYLSVLFASLGGFLFGYQTGIIAGALHFIANEFSLGRFQQSNLVSSILMGALLGSLIAGTLADKYGRKATIAFSSIIFLIASLLSAFAGSYESLLLFRFISGIGVGIVSLICPLYIAEISPAERRGSLVCVNQFAVTVGILSSYIFSYMLSVSGNWRLMLGIGALPALIQIFFLFFVSDTPKSTAPKEKWNTFFEHISKKVLFIGIALNIFQQITGINVVIYFAPIIFLEAGFDGPSLALYASISIAIINVFASVISIWLLDKVGRRLFLLIGMLGMGLSLVFLSLAFLTGMSAIDKIAPFCLMAYVAFFAIGIGPITAIFIAEVFPLKLRGKAMSIATFANWGSNYLVSLTFLTLVGNFGIGKTFSLYALLSLLAFYFIYLFIRETKGKSLDELETLYK